MRTGKDGRKKIIYLDNVMSDNGSPVDTIMRNPETRRWEIFNHMTGFSRYAKYRGFVFGNTFQEALKNARKHDEE